MRTRLLILALLFLFSSCKAQDYIAWIQPPVSPPSDTACVEYGLLYNWYAATDTNIVADGWRVPVINDFETLITYLGGSSIAGSKMKETGIVHWTVENATNEAMFNGRGAGVRQGADGVFSLISLYEYMWVTDDPIGSATNRLYLLYAPSAAISAANYVSLKERGASIRLVKESTTLSDGQSGEYVGNDGHIYRTICIGTQEWLADNLIETKFRNGDIIPFHGADNDTAFTNAEWAALTTAGVCAYANNTSYVGCSFSFPTE